MDADLTDLIDRLRKRADEAIAEAEVFGESAATQSRGLYEWPHAARANAVIAGGHANLALDLRLALALLSRSCEECKHQNFTVDGQPYCWRLNAPPEFLGNVCGKWEATCRE